jgi:hypothetical protein
MSQQCAHVHTDTYGTDIPPSQQGQAHAITQSDESPIPYLHHVGVHNLGRCMCQYIPVSFVRVFNCCPLSNVFRILHRWIAAYPFLDPGPLGTCTSPHPHCDIQRDVLAEPARRGS